MADRIIDNDSQDVPDIPEMVERVLVFSLDEAKERIERGEVLVPFTALIVKENLFLESHPGDSAEECFNAAEHTVKGARGADGYAFCYDGYIETDGGTKDAIIAEGGEPGADEGFAVAYLYEVDDLGNFEFEAEPAYVGQAPNFMSALKTADAYEDSEIEAKYLDDEETEAVEEAVEEARTAAEE